MKHAIFPRSGRKRQGGYIALISVLIASALLLLIGIGVTSRGIDANELSFGEESSAAARLLADSCADEAILKLKANLGYSGGEIIMVGGGETCAVVSVLGSGNTNRTIETEASRGGYVSRTLVDVAQVNPTLTVRSWGAVASF
jgi:hypothetical protein